MTSNIKNFLLIFDHSQNELVVCKDFGTDVNRATAAYAEAEQQHRGSNVVDIVLVGSDSIETVQITHSTYFKNGSRSLIERALASH